MITKQPKMLSDRLQSGDPLGPRLASDPGQLLRVDATKLTPARLARRERIVLALKRRGVGKSRAFAIATASVLGQIKRRKRR